MADDIDHGSEAIRAAASAIRGLNPPAAAAEAWVRSRAAEIDAIGRSLGLDRPSLAHALLSAGVAQRGDRTRPLGPTALSRALRGGRREEADRRHGIELQKLENAVFRTVAALLPSVTEEVARRAAAEAIRMAARTDQSAAAVNAPAATPPQAAVPAPVPTTKASAFEQLGSAFEKPAAPVASSKPAFESLRTKPLHEIIGRKG